eukprot:scaffold208369_cov65-Cyclotella_meneghiniana.AAC.1
MRHWIWSKGANVCYVKTESHRVKVVRQETLRSYINRAATNFENLPQSVRTSLIFSLPFCTGYTSHVTTAPNAGLLPLAASEPIIPYIFSTSRGLEDFGNLHPVTKSTIPFSGRQVERRNTFFRILLWVVMNLP